MSGEPSKMTSFTLRNSLRTMTVCIMTFIIFATFMTTACNAASEKEEHSRPKPKSPPNIIVVLTDDQDELSLPLETTMPQTKRLIVDRGVRFTRAFANTPVCCPSRATLLSGRYPHAPGMTRSNRVNCDGKEWRSGPELDTIAVKMQEKGYRTLYAGKYLNSYGTGDPSPSQVPPGWNEWFALVGNSRYWNYSVSDNGFETKYGSICGAGDYFTDTLARRAVKFIRSTSLPFFLWVSPPAAHVPFAPAQRHMGAWAKKELIKSPAYNISAVGKHDPVSLAKPLSKEMELEISEMFRFRGETLLAVDEMVISLVAALKDRQLDNSTFLIITSDNAFHLGEFRLGFDKRQPYETDIRVPLAIFGPGVDQGATRSEFVSHVDLAPTILDLAGQGDVPSDWDGQSFKALLFSNHMSENEQDEDKKDRYSLVLVEYEGEADPLTNGVLTCGASKTTFDDLGRARGAGLYHGAICDSWNNTYTCLRGSTNSFMGHEFLFCQFDCFAMVKPGPVSKRGVKTQVPCAKSSANAMGEYYDLSKDPFQLENRIQHLNILTKRRLLRRLDVLRKCRGAFSCAAARMGKAAHDDEEDDGETQSNKTGRRGKTTVIELDDRVEKA